MSLLQLVGFGQAPFWGRETTLEHLVGVQEWKTPPCIVSAVLLASSTLRNEEETCDNPMRY